MSELSPPRHVVLQVVKTTIDYLEELYQSGITEVDIDGERYYLDNELDHLTEHIADDKSSHKRLYKDACWSLQLLEAVVKVQAEIILVNKKINLKTELERLDNLFKN